ncbi:non-ribosomal peptide synthetase [Streptomyces rhizosphaerihabitans]|uniref:non-ribosomal peptide synthetase n=1 Tax=Streptomyces rhizosphaerihabitans TaxID=1266770 RepID=UPI0021BE1644|nr:amino acid adenylation domain-containing protein [Streptomyces rhizosphaerihabitans]MCT9008990.1 amino acid adenylation domain-containing protein [Streptomyces rhizosphaerihabitans]
MNTSARTSAEYWRDVLLAGGSTSVPRWTRTPMPGTAVSEAAIPEPLVAELDRLATSTGVSSTSLMLAAHAKVLAALSGESAVTTGYVPVAHTSPQLCRLTTGTASWRSLLLHAHATEAELLAHQEFPVEALREELGLPTIVLETVFDPTGDGVPVQGTVLHVAIARHDGRSVIRLRYRTEVIDDACATRIVGYHLTALRLIAADPDATHGRQSLLSHDELRYQLDGLAGPCRDLPDLRCHELFEQRVRAHPEVVAAVQNDRQWTYRELNSRANQIAHALLNAGLGRQDVVAVVTERSLEWMSGVLGVLKAGGAYLPIEPHFPAQRIAAMLTRAGCALVLTESGSTATLDGAMEHLPEIRTLLIDRLCEQSGDDSDPGVAVASDGLAYVFFTSGSTGEPKGAMCEHAGLLNHLFAKIDDLEVGEGDAVAQTAPQCFDISLWQLLSALLVGGRTLLVDQEAILDVGRFLDTLADGRAGVLQVVPSYLDVVLSFLERHPRELPDLRCVSVTGEAVKKDLVKRWFRAQPDVRLVNAYGLTETSDDTNHAVMDRVPDGDQVPLGRPVNNVRVYLVDEHLSPVPLGAPGAIAFSGICVGRGYINDPERTRAAFLPDPYRKGERLHLSGDYGRWLPDGQLEFLGRRDNQVKVRGFRIEIGEIEDALLRVPGVHDAAVVVAEGAARGRHLLAFYSSGRPLKTTTLQERLGGILPAYMVPSAFSRREALPLTDNGKIDRAQLTSLAAESNPLDEHGDDTPRTPTERRLAAVWAEVLGVPRNRVGRRDDFFDRGGTSLSAVRVAISLDREVTLKDLVRHPVLTDLAELVDRRSAP